MIRSIFMPGTRLGFMLLVWIALIGCATLAAQTDTTLTPAQQKAQAARAARQAAAQQAAQNRAAAAQARAAAAQNKTTPQSRTVAKSATPNGVTTPLGSTANTTGNSLRPGTVPATATTPSTAQKTTGTGTVGSGTLSWQTRVYSSTGCQHNGNSAVCTFSFTNQGNEATLVAGSEMAGIQLVDDAHVPHRANSAHFLDKYGTQQPRLLVQPGDTGTYVLTFPNVNSQVTTGDFHLRQQIVGGVTFSGSNSGIPSTPAKESPSPSGNAPK
jgi:hypothetical protein